MTASHLRRGKRHDPLVVACLVPAAGASCDWGECERPGVGFAFSAEHGWLDACAVCLTDAALTGVATVVDHLAVRND